MAADLSHNARSASAFHRRRRARVDILIAALRVVAQTYEGATEPEVADAYEQMELAARNLTRAVDQQAVAQQPVGWAL